MKKVFLSFGIMLFLPLLFLSCEQEVHALPASASAADLTGEEEPCTSFCMAVLPDPDPPKPSILLTFAGDIMAHNVNFNMEDYNDIYAGVRDILLTDDLSFANLEFPVYDDVPMSTFPMFNVHTPYVTAAVDAGFDVFSMANNHTTDKGPKGVLATYGVMETLCSERGVSFSGIRNDPEAPYKPKLIEKNGWRIGFIAVTQWLNTYWGGDYAHYLDYNEEEEKNAFFEMLDGETDKYDLFILSFHGGVEYATVPDKGKISFFEECIGHGVDIIWSHHPHVLQPWHLDTTREGGKLFLYSAGNFISGQAWFQNADNPDHPRAVTGDGALFQVRIQEVNDKYRIHGVTPVLISNYKDPEKGMINKILTLLPKDETIPEKWRKFYTRRFQIINSHVADYSIRNILP